MQPLAVHDRYVLVRDGGGGGGRGREVYLPLGSSLTTVKKTSTFTKVNEVGQADRLNSIEY